MKNYAILFNQFILRAMLREKVRTAIVLVGIALGVAVTIAIRLANRSVTDSFRSAVDSVSGAATLRLRGPSGRFDELLLRDALWLQEFGQVSPVIETYAMVADNSASQTTSDFRPAGELLHVMGVDVLQDTPIRKYRLLKISAEHYEAGPRELLRLLTEPDSVVLTEKFCQRTGKKLGEPIDLIFGSTRKTLRIRGLLLNDGPARALDGNFALMDIAAAQWASGQLGYLDHVDLKLDSRHDVQVAREEIGRRLAPGLIVETPGEQLGRAETMVAAFQFNLLALSGNALLVGAMLIYNSMSVSVAARRDEIGMLQAVGASRGMVLAVFLGEASLLAVLGAIFGLGLGSLLARSALKATAQTVDAFYVAEVATRSAEGLSLGRDEVLLALGLALGLSLLAAALPAVRAARSSPLEVISSNRQAPDDRRTGRRHLLPALTFLVLGMLATRIGPIADRPAFGFIAQLLLTLSGVCLAPIVLSTICRWVRDHLAARLPEFQISCQLAASNLLGAVSRISISIAALAISLAMMVSISVMVGSFRETVVYWLNSTLHADLFVWPTILTSTLMEAHIDHEAAERIRHDPDVVATGWFYGRQVPFGQRIVRVAATDMNALLDQRVFLFKSPADAAAAVRAAAVADGVLVSEGFSLRFDKQPGDLLEFPAADGKRQFRVAAVYYDYASNQGTVLMNGATYAKCFGESDPASAPANFSIYLRPGADPEAVRARLTRAVGDRQELFFATNEAIRSEALRIFDSTFTITYALEFIALVIAGLGIVSTLIALIYERQREIALLSLVGATPGQIRQMVIIEALLIGGVSQALGILIGLGLAMVLIYVINVQSFAWTIQFHLPLLFLGQSTALVLATAALCGLYPATRAANIHALKVTREE